MTEEQKSRGVTGECFPWAIKFISDVDKERSETGLTGDDPVMIHAVITHPETGKQYEHAWVEMNDRVYDWQNMEMDKRGSIEKDLFYSVTQPTNIRQFTAEEAMVNMLRVGHSGPWPTSGKQPFERKTIETVDGEEIELSPSEAADKFYLAVKGIFQ